MALPTGPRVTARTSVTASHGVAVEVNVTPSTETDAGVAAATSTETPVDVTVTASHGAAVEVNVTPSAEITVDVSVAPNGGGTTTPKNGLSIRWKIIILIGFFALFGLAGMILPWASTFIGATLVAIGGALSVIHRAKAESNIDLENDSVNLPIAMVGLGGVLVAGSALAPFIDALKVFLG